MKKILHLKFNKGFTIVELMVTMIIFAFMTTFLIAKYGKFDQSLLLTNFAFDVALAIRNAQSYGLSVKSLPDQGGGFNFAYGVALQTGTQFFFFTDLIGDGAISGGEELIKTYNAKKNMTIYSVCAGTGTGVSCIGANNSNTRLYITFKRPEPDAIIRLTPYGANQDYAEIILRSSDGTTKKVVVRKTGQISVENT